MKIFEEIYNDCNSPVVMPDNLLKSPLDTDSKPLLLMEEIYFECNVKPLFEKVFREAHLREMGKNYSVSTGGNYASVVDNKIRNINTEITKEINIAKEQNITTDEIMKKQKEQLLEVWSDNSIKDSVSKTIQKGLTGNNRFILEYTEDEIAAGSNKISMWLNNLKNTIQEKLKQSVPLKNGKPDLSYFEKIINIFKEHLKLNQ